MPEPRPMPEETLAKFEAWIVDLDATKVPVTKGIGLALIAEIRRLKPYENGIKAHWRTLEDFEEDQQAWAGVTALMQTADKELIDSLSKNLEAGLKGKEVPQKESNDKPTSTD